MKYFFILFILFLSVTTNTKAQPPCGEPATLKNVCSHVLNFVTEQDKGYAYGYERILYISACVDWKTPESDERISKKINELINTYPQHFKCAGLEYPQASIFMAAIKARMTDFVYDATTIWRINLNNQEQYDNDNTALDYLEVEIRRNDDGGVPSIIKALKEMKTVLIEQGAKRKSELLEIKKKFTTIHGYEDIKHIAHGMLLAKKSGKWGIVTENNSPVIPAIYTSISYFTPYSAKVSSDGIKFHFINLKNEIIKDPWDR